MNSEQIELFNINSDSHNRRKYDDSFSKAYESLNPEQKKAVDHIEGPVMVLAGPGTGKTQILAVRIGKILKETDSLPHNILCLTFTEAATQAMRRRLVDIIGPTAHQVHIFTFHSFCNHVIQENLNIFSDYKKLDLLSDLEEIEVYQTIFNRLSSDHILKNPKGNDQYEMRRLKNLFSFMKKENLAAEEIQNKVDVFLKEKLANKQDKQIYYQRKFKSFNKGDLKEAAWEDLNYKMKQLVEAGKLLGEYDKLLSHISRYDYQDMLLWVLNGFITNPLLLSSYQERYQYFLVDEYQDTNGAQNDLLEILISFWEEKPNAFVVGDDDQAIYKFQGANVKNVEDFWNKYNPFTVVLERNYRSSPPILKWAKNLITNNNERLANKDNWNLTKGLFAVGRNRKIRTNPKILAFSNETQEFSYLVDLLLKAKQNNEVLSKIAILYRQHSQVSQFVSVLEHLGIPLNIKKKVNILHDPLIHNILTILRYLNAEHEQPKSGENLLVELMHFSFFGIASRDIAKIALHKGKEHQKGQSPGWREIISESTLLEKIGISKVEEVNRLSDLIESWISNISNRTLQVLFENVLNDGFILKYVLNQPDKSWLLQLLNTFFDLIKEETSKKANFRLSQFLEMVDKMIQYEIPLHMNKVIHSNEGINFITTHSSKGLEFDRVFIIGATKDKWDKVATTRFKYAYPDNINEDSETNAEDERRLFFVAMTRAESELTITYAENRDDGKPLGPSQFVDEIIAATDLEKSETEVPVEKINQFLEYALKKSKKAYQFVERELVDQTLHHYKLSVTGLNKYLRCPITFYFEDMLRVPRARSMYMGFGSAVHQAFQNYYQNIKDKKETNQDTLVKHFEYGMKDHLSHFTKQEYNNLLAYGSRILTRYHSALLGNEHIYQSYELELKLENAELGGIPIKGVLDKVAIDGKSAIITDYKTGNYSRWETKKKLQPPSNKNLIGGDYWRQIVFYKILTDGESKLPWRMTLGIVDFVEPDKRKGEFFHKKYEIGLDDIELVGTQIHDVWDKIHLYKFNDGCNEDTCYWCNFVQNEYVFLGHNHDGEEDIIKGVESKFKQEEIF